MSPLLTLCPPPHFLGPPPSSWTDLDAGGWRVGAELEEAEELRAGLKGPRALRQNCTFPPTSSGHMDTPFFLKCGNLW